MSEELPLTGEERQLAKELKEIWEENQEDFVNKGSVTGRREWSPV